MSTPEPVDILLVDDQPVELPSWETILAPLGENLIRAGSAAQALEVALERDVAIVLIDVGRPDVDGFERAARIRAHPRLRRAAIIFVSAIQPTDRDLLRGYQLGAVDYVPAPMVPDLLRAKVKVFAELHRNTRTLEKLNADLELRVADCTAALARANEELEQRVEQRTREREAALAQVQQMQKLESLSRLTAGVAHDFNNLLMAVLGNLELVRKRIANEPRLLRLVDGAIQGAERGAGLTRRLLAFARRQELRPQAVQVDRLIDGMVEMLRRALGPAIRVITEFSADLAPTRVDPDQFELALLNLAVNAREAMPDGGALHLSARGERVEAGRVAGLRPGDYVCIRVRDTGSGMDDATLERATEPFFTTKGPGRGAGLGLSMVDGLVAQSGGAIHIASEPERGTKVELWLPAAGDEAEAEVAPLSPAPGEPRYVSVLVVDDDPAVAAGTAAMIEDLGHLAIEASSGAAALDLLRSGATVDVVITDYAMPGMTGVELAAAIARDWPDLPLAITTGYADMPSAGRKLPRLSKPYRQRELANLIDALVGPRLACPGPAGNPRGGKD